MEQKQNPTIKIPKSNIFWGTSSSAVSSSAVSSSAVSEQQHTTEEVKITREPAKRKLFETNEEPQKRGNFQSLREQEEKEEHAINEIFNFKCSVPLISPHETFHNADLFQMKSNVEHSIGHILTPNTKFYVGLFEKNKPGNVPEFAIEIKEGCYSHLELNKVVPLTKVEIKEAARKATASFVSYRFNNKTNTLNLCFVVSDVDGRKFSIALVIQDKIIDDVWFGDFNLLTIETKSSQTIKPTPIYNAKPLPEGFSGKLPKPPIIGVQPPSIKNTRLRANKGWAIQLSPH